MNAQQNNNLLKSVRSSRGTIFSGALLLAVLMTIFAAPAASAEDTISEVTAAAGNVTEPVTAAASAASAAAPTDVAPPPAPTPPPAPVVDPSAVTETVTSTVDHALGADAGGAGGAVSEVVRESAQRSAASVDRVVTQAAGTAQVPVVEDVVRGASATADSLASGTAEVTKTDGSRSSSPAPNSDAETTHERTDTSASPADRVEPPASAPAPGSHFTLSAPRGKTHLAAPGNAAAPAPVAAAIDISSATNHPGPAPVGTDNGSAPVGSQGTPSFPPSPAGTAASPAPAGGFGSSLLLLGLLALVALAAPRTSRRLLSASASYRPAAFICALERPG